MPALKKSGSSRATGKSTAFPCPLCPKTFHRMDHQRRHTKLAHSVSAPDRRHQCYHCSKNFNRSDSLHRHLRLHRNPKPSLLQTGARACYHCRTSKSRCRDGVPCTRCRERSLLCSQSEPPFASKASSEPVEDGHYSTSDEKSSSDHSTVATDFVNGSSCQFNLRHSRTTSAILGKVMFNRTPEEIIGSTSDLCPTHGFSTNKSVLREFLDTQDAQYPPKPPKVTYTLPPLLSKDVYMQRFHDLLTPSSLHVSNMFEEFWDDHGFVDHIDAHLEQSTSPNDVNHAEPSVAEHNWTSFELPWLSFPDANGKLPWLMRNPPSIASINGLGDLRPSVKTGEEALADPRAKQTRKNPNEPNLDWFSPVCHKKAETT